MSTRLTAVVGAILALTMVSLEGQSPEPASRTRLVVTRPLRRLELRDADAVRAAGGSRRLPFFTDEQAKAFEADQIGRNDRDRRDGGSAVDAARGVAEFWFDRGTRVGTLDGKKPTSWVIDPPDGRVPPLTPAARARAAAQERGPARSSGRWPGEPVAAGALPGVQCRAADRPRSLQQLPADFPDAPTRWSSTPR